MRTPATLALIDASGYLYRAFHAIRGLVGPSGRPTNATYGFATMLRKFLAARTPDSVAVCFDRRERTFRHEMDASYKAQRMAMPDELVPQIEDAKRLCAAMGLPVVEAAGFEADDLIGTLAARGEKAGMRVEIASADKDLFQLVKDDRVVVWHPKEERLLDAAGVAEYFGVPPERVVDVLALMGDSSDNIPGVAGIGEKGAKELVRAFGGLEAIYERLDEVKGKKRENLEAGRDAAFHSRALALVRCDVPIGDEGFLDTLHLRPKGPDEVRALAALYDELGFTTLKKELLAGQGVELAPPTPARTDERARWETQDEALKRFVETALAAKRAGVFVASAPGRPFPPAPLAAAVALPGGETVAFPLDGEAGRRILGMLFEAPDLLVVAHDAKALHLVADTLGIKPPARARDVMLESYMVSPGLHAHDLSGDARAVLDRAPETIPTSKEVFGTSGMESAASFAGDAALLYLGVRARLPLTLADCLDPRFEEGAGPTLRSVLETIELPLVPVLARMERTGIQVDRRVLAEMSGEFASRLSTLENRIHGAAGESFNVGSPAQLGRILFEKLGYPVLKKTSKTKSYATDSAVLEELAQRDVGPLPGLILEWRELSKLKGTYVDALPTHIAADGRIHTRFDQAVAATGRLSSNDPNLQNIPVRTEAGRAIRRAFVAPEGRVLLAADYSQIELRLLAHLSGDEALISTFERGEDIHRATAARVFGVEPESVTADQRRGAKTINFGVLYGMGPFALAGQLGISQADAKAFITAYFDRFPKVRACLDAILEEARATGATTTLFGRVRPVPGLHDRNFAVRSNAERMARNAPFQGTAADLIKKSMIALDAALSRESPSARLLLQVHDELVIECAAADAAATATLAKATMEGVASLRVPLTVEVGQGSNWAEAK